MKNILFLLFASSYLWSFSQNFSITSQKVIGGSSSDGLTAYRIPDGTGYFFIGESSSNTSGDKSEDSFGLSDIWLVKTDNNFNILWDKTYGGNLVENFYSTFFLNNNLFIVANSNSPISGNKTIDSNNGSFDVWILEVNTSDGTIIDEHLIGGDSGEVDIKVIEKNNEIIYLSFSSSSSNSGTIGISNIGSMDVYICEYSLDTKQVLEENYIGTTSSDRLNELTLIDGEVVLSIASTGGDNDLPTTSFGQDDAYFCKLNNSLEVVDVKNFGGTSSDNISKFIQVGQVVYALGSSNSPVSGNKESDNFGNTRGFWMIQLDTDLEHIWDVSYGGFGSDLFRTAYIDNNGRIVAGLSSQVLGSGGDRTCPLYGGADGWVIALDPADGNLIAQTSFGGDSDDFLFGILPINNSGDILVSMTSPSGISGNKTLASKGATDLWLIEVDASDYLSIEENIQNASLNIFPNPTNNVLNIQSKQNFGKIVILNSDGKTVLTTDQKQIDVSNFSNGLYFLEALLENGSVVREKFLKE